MDCDHVNPGVVGVENVTVSPLMLVTSAHATNTRRLPLVVFEEKLPVHEALVVPVPLPPKLL